MIVLTHEAPKDSSAELSPKDLEEIHQIICALYAPDMLLTEFPSRVSDLLRRVIPCEIPLIAASQRNDQQRKTVTSSLKRTASLEETLEGFFQLFSEWERLDAKSTFAAEPPSDLTAYRERLCLLSSQTEIAFPFQSAVSPGGKRYYIAFRRASPSQNAFTPREQAILAMLQPHLLRAFDIAELRSVVSGEPLSPEMLRSILPITPRQSEILAWVAAGKTNEEISIITGLKEGNVKLHMGAILRRLGAENRTTAARIALNALMKVQARRAGCMSPTV